MFNSSLSFVDDRTSAICLTVDHKPDNLTEEERINKAGGTIMRKAGVMRVVWTRPLKNHVGPARRSTPTESVAFLSVARSLGKFFYFLTFIFCLCFNYFKRNFITNLRRSLVIQ